MSEASASAAHDESLRRFPGIFGGLIDEYKRRARYCGADFTTAFTYPQKALAAAIFIWLATLFSTVSLAGVIEHDTKGRIGMSEYLTVNSVAGMIHALFGTQPLIVLRPTGPITAIVGDLSKLADSAGVDFYHLLAATGVCTGACMLVVVAFELSRFVKLLTPWSMDVFNWYVCSIYVFDGVHGEISKVTRNSQGLPSATLAFGSTLAILTVVLSLLLHYFGRSLRRPFGTVVGERTGRQLATLVADYSVFAAVVMTTLLSYAVSGVQRISLPEEFSLTNKTRPLLVDFSTAAAPTLRKTWLIAAGAALLITAFFYVDQNISSRMCQRGLNRGQYYHGSFFAMAVFNIVGPLFGLPFVTGSLPHSPQLSYQLLLDEDTVAVSKGGGKEGAEAAAATAAQAAGGGGGGASGGATTGAAVHAGPQFAENRLTPMLAYALIGLPLFAAAMINVVPVETMSGVLIFVGLEGILSSQMWARTRWMLFSGVGIGGELPPTLRAAGVDDGLARAFTLCQLGSYVMCASFFVASKLTGLQTDMLVGFIVIFVVQPLKGHFVRMSQATEKQISALDSLEIPMHAQSSSSSSSSSSDGSSGAAAPTPPNESTQLLSP